MLKNTQFKRKVISVTAAMLVVAIGWVPAAWSAEKGETSAPAAAREMTPLMLAQADAGEAQGGGSQITNVSADSNNGNVAITVESSGSLQYTAFKLNNPLRLVLDFPGMERGNLPESVAVNQGVVGNVRPMYFDEAKVMRLEIDLKQAASYEIQKPDSSHVVIMLEDAPVQVAQAPAPSPAMDTSNNMGGEMKSPSMSKLKLDPCDKLVGGEKQKISLDFQNANIKNIFRIISEVAGLNIVLSPEVSGTSNIRMNDVGWNTALDVILQNNNYGMDCDDNIIRIAPKATLKASKEDDTVVTEMVRLNYANLGETLASLQSLKTSNGKLVSDARTNTLILTDTRDALDDMIAIIQSLDVRTPQVMIESKIVQMNRSFTQELGVQWSAFSSRKSGDGFPNDLVFGGDRASRNFKFNLDNVQTDQNGNQFIPNPVNPGFIVDLATQSQPAFQFGALLADALGNDALDIQLQALERQGKSKIMANPKVTTLDNKEAKIKSGSQIPYQTTSANEGTKIQFIDAVLSLTVTPHITADEKVYMKIAAQQNDPDFGRQVAGAPVINTKEATTEVLVNDGDTTVLGGLYQKTVSENRTSVPYLSDIPIFGLLFKNKQEQDNINELLIFITPSIIKNVDTES